MTPELWAFVNRITGLSTIHGKDELRYLADETLIDICWVLCGSVKTQAEVINNAVKVLTD